MAQPGVVHLNAHAAPAAAAAADALQLHRALQTPNLELLQRLVADGADVEAADENGWTPALVAAANGDFEALAFLAKEGANLMRANNDGWTVTTLAAKLGKTAVLDFLHGRNALCNRATNDGFTPALIAAQENHFHLVKYLARLRAVLTDVAEDGSTLTLFAAHHGNMDALRFLVLNDVEQIDRPCNSGETPVYVAASAGYVDVVKYLACLGADLERPASDGLITNPLDVARRHGHQEVVQLLESLLEARSWPPTAARAPSCAGAHQRRAALRYLQTRMFERAYYPDPFAESVAAANRVRDQHPADGSMASAKWRDAIPRPPNDVTPEVPYRYILPFAGFDDGAWFDNTSEYTDAVSPEVLADLVAAMERISWPFDRPDDPEPDTSQPPRRQEGMPIMRKKLTGGDGEVSRLRGQFRDSSSSFATADRGIGLAHARQCVAAEAWLPESLPPFLDACGGGTPKFMVAAFSFGVGLEEKFVSAVIETEGLDKTTGGLGGATLEYNGLDHGLALLASWAHSLHVGCYGHEAFALSRAAAQSCLNISTRLLQTGIMGTSESFGGMLFYGIFVPLWHTPASLGLNEIMLDGCATHTYDYDITTIATIAKGFAPGCGDRNMREVLKGGWYSRVPLPPARPDADPATRLQRASLKMVCPVAQFAAPTKDTVHMRRLRLLQEAAVNVYAAARSEMGRNLDGDGTTTRKKRKAMVLESQAALAHRVTAAADASVLGYAQGLAARPGGPHGGMAYQFARGHLMGAQALHALLTEDFDVLGDNSVFTGNHPGTHPEVDAMIGLFRSLVPDKTALQPYMSSYGAKWHFEFNEYIDLFDVALGNNEPARYTASWLMQAIPDCCVPRVPSVEFLGFRTY